MPQLVVSEHQSFTKPQKPVTIEQMIAYLVGQPLVIDEKLIVVVNGVGYGVHVPRSVLVAAHHLPEITLHVYTHVREEALELFGFAAYQDKELFLLLLSVSGVGPKTALHIVDLGADKIITAVQTAEVSTFAAVPRVGKKLAQKIIIELKSKLGSLQELQLGPQNQQQQDVQEALLGLGFSDSQVERAMSQLIWETSDSNAGRAQASASATGTLIKQAIKLMTTKE